MSKGKIRLFGGPASRATGVFAALILSCLWFTLESSRQHLQARALAGAQDGAATLALALQPVLAEDNLVGAETRITAMMQTGNYGVIALYDAGGELLLEQSREPAIPAAPAWFRGLFSVEVMWARAQVSRGWELAGTLEVTADSHEAYAQLWRLAQGIVGLGLIALAVLYALLWQWARGVRRQLEMDGESARGESAAQETLVYPAGGSFKGKSKKQQRGKRQPVPEPLD